jgi:hypothetical protein
MLFKSKVQVFIGLNEERVRVYLTSIILLEALIAPLKQQAKSTKWDNHQELQ